MFSNVQSKIKTKELMLRRVLLQHIKTSLYINAFYLMIGTVGTSFMGFVFWIIAARFYKSNDIGLASAAISASHLIGIFAELGFVISLIRFLPSAGNDANILVNTCFSLCGLTSFILSILFLSAIEFLSPSLALIRNEPLSLIAFIAYSWVCVQTSLISSFFIAKRATKYITIQAFLSKPLNIAFVILFAFVVNSSFSILLSMLISSLFAILIGFFWFMPKLQKGYKPLPKIKVRILKNIYNYSLGSYVSRVFLLIPAHIFPIMVVNVLGAEINAYFYIAWSFISILQIIPSSISNSLFAEGSNQELFFHEKIMKSLKLIFLMLIPSILFFVIMADKLLLIFGHSYSKNASITLQILSLSVIPWSMNYLYITLGRVKKDLKGILIVSISAAVLALGIGYILMPFWGLIGASLGWLIGLSVVAIPVTFRIFWKFPSFVKDNLARYQTRS